MSRAETVKIESGDAGFELHLTLDEDLFVDAEGRAVLNIQAVAEDLLRECVTKIGPWVLEGLRVRREMGRPPMSEPEDDEPWPFESAVDYYKRTGDTALLFEHADTLRKAAKENP